MGPTRVLPPATPLPSLPDLAPPLFTADNRPRRFSSTPAVVVFPLRRLNTTLTAVEDSRASTPLLLRRCLTLPLPLTEGTLLLLLLTTPPTRPTLLTAAGAAEEAEELFSPLLTSIRAVSPLPSVLPARLTSPTAAVRQLPHPASRRSSRTRTLLDSVAAAGWEEEEEEDPSGCPSRQPSPPDTPRSPLPTRSAR